MKWELADSGVVGSLVGAIGFGLVHACVSPGIAQILLAALTIAIYALGLAAIVYKTPK